MMVALFCIYNIESCLMIIAEFTTIKQRAGLLSWQQLNTVLGYDDCRVGSYKEQSWPIIFAESAAMKPRASYDGCWVDSFKTQSWEMMVAGLAAIKQ